VCEIDQKFPTVWEKCQKTSGFFDWHCIVADVNVLSQQTIIIITMATTRNWQANLLNCLSKILARRIGRHMTRVRVVYLSSPLGSRMIYQCQRARHVREDTEYPKLSLSHRATWWIRVRTSDVSVYWNWYCKPELKLTKHKLSKTEYSIRLRTEFRKEQ